MPLTVMILPWGLFQVYGYNKAYIIQNKALVIICKGYIETVELASYFPNRGESGSQLPASGTREYQIISREMRMKVVVTR